MGSIKLVKIDLALDRLPWGNFGGIFGILNLDELKRGQCDPELHIIINID